MIRDRKIGNFIIFAVMGSLRPLLNFIFLPFYTKYLSPESYGVIAFIDSIILFATVVSILGLHHYFMRNYYVIDRCLLYSTLTRFLLILNLIILLCCFAGSFSFQKIDYRISFILAGSTNFLNTFIILPLREIRLKEKALQYGITYSGLAIGQNLLSLLLISKGYGVMGRYIGYFAVMFFIGGYYLVRTLPFLKYGFNSELIRQAIHLGVAMSISATAMMAVNVVNRIILKAFVPFDQIGLYSVGYAFGFLLSIISNALFITFEPGLYKCDLERSFPVEFAGRYALSFVLVLVPAIIVVAFCEQIFKPFINLRFHSCFPITRITAFTGLYYMCYNFYSQFAVRNGKQKYLLITTSIGAAMNIILCVALTPIFGIKGAAYSSLFAYGLIAVIFSWLFKGIPILRIIHLKIILIPGVLNVVSLFIRQWSITNSIIFSVVGLVAAMWLIPEAMISVLSPYKKSASGSI